MLYHFEGIWAGGSLFASGDVVEWLRSIKVFGRGAGSLNLAEVDTFFMYHRNGPSWKGLPGKDMFHDVVLGGMQYSSWFLVSSKHNRVMKKFMDRFEESVFSGQKIFRISWSMRRSRTWHTQMQMWSTFCARGCRVLRVSKRINWTMLNGSHSVDLIVNI